MIIYKEDFFDIDVIVMAINVMVFLESLVMGRPLPTHLAMAMRIMKIMTKLSLHYHSNW